MNPEELKQIAVLQPLQSEALSRFASILEERQYSNAQQVFAEGDPGDAMYFIVQGCIRIEKRAHGGSQKTLAILEAGDYFGEMALLNHTPRTASAISTGETRLLRLSKAAFDQLHQTNSPTALELLFGMIRTSSDRIRWLSTQLIAYDEVGKAIGDGRDLQSLSNLILEQLAAASGADWGLIVLRSEFTGRLDLRAQFNLRLTAAQVESIGNGEGFLEPILRQPQFILTEDFDAHELFQACGRIGIESASLLIAPIMLCEQVVGLIVLGGGRKNQFLLNTLNLVRGISQQAAQAILDTRRREEDAARTRKSRPFARA